MKDTLYRIFKKVYFHTIIRFFPTGFMCKQSVPVNIITYIHYVSVDVNGLMGSIDTMIKVFIFNNVF